ncbi:MAG TPA: DNA replication/repair protein RecF [Acidimicrobiia bacterium]|nr:DNA replication/repair protein RecF [Acidimicrobiia bacterium]
MSVVTRLALTYFRCYSAVDLLLPTGVTVVAGANGEGKTSLLEALGWAATTHSFRGVPDAALVRTGAEAAYLRVSVQEPDRDQLMEAEIRAVGRNRVQVNRHPLARARDLLGLVRVTVFAPDDLQLVKGGPAGRRSYLDELLVAIAPRYDAVRAEFDRVLKQRNALLRQGLRGPDADSTLVVFDDQLVRAGSEIVRGRLRLTARLLPALRDAYQGLAGPGDEVEAAYEAEWAEGSVASAADDIDELLRAALLSRRAAEVERGVTLVGPHRDEWRVRLAGLEARTHASQGEQRTLALGLRLAGHRVVADVVGTEPVLLLDDVFSELDPARADALVAQLPAGQTLITTASAVPRSVHPERRLRVHDGRVEEA